MAAYFGLLIFVAHWTTKSSSNTAFFTGNRQSPWYVVSFGMIGASLSGVTFISIPGSVGVSSLSYLQMVLGYFVGYMVVWNVKPALHTPLMSVTNAISSIIAIGALVQISPIANAAARPNTLIIVLASLALVLTAINMFGGFAVTQRMLAMFRK